MKPLIFLAVLSRMCQRPSPFDTDLPRERLDLTSPDENSPWERPASASELSDEGRSDIQG